MSHTSNAIVQCVDGQAEQIWVPQTLAALGKDEEYLEETIANAPSLLRIENRRTGIHGPYVILRQLDFTTPQDRGIRPDIVMLAASGHVVVVEVKLCTNPELRDRRVIAQIVDYAASFAALSEEEVIALFNRKGDAATSWPQLVEGWFPGEVDVEELADTLLRRLQTGQLNLVIACDKAPPGLAELVKGVTSQATIEFDLDLVEVEPYVQDGADTADILFVPRAKLATEVVARTAVTVTYHEGEPKPGVTVETTSVEEIEENIRQAAEGQSSSRRKWTRELFLQELEAMEDSLLSSRIRSLLDLPESRPDVFGSIGFGTGQDGSFIARSHDRYACYYVYLSGQLRISGPDPEKVNLGCVQAILSQYGSRLHWNAEFSEDLREFPALSDSLSDLDEEQFDQLKQLLLEYVQLGS